MKTNYKRIPFNIELAKKIINKETKGRIVTLKGKNVRIVCWDKKRNSKVAPDYPIVVIAENDYDGELLYTCTKEGLASYPNYKNCYNLTIEIPTHYKDYSNFVPKELQPCLVRDTNDDYWKIRVCASNNPTVTFYDTGGWLISRNEWHIKLPLSKVTKRLIGTKKSYKQLCKELDK